MAKQKSSETVRQFSVDRYRNKIDRDDTFPSMSHFGRICPFISARHFWHNIDSSIRVFFFRLSLSDWHRPCWRSSASRDHSRENVANSILHKLVQQPCRRKLFFYHVLLADFLHWQTIYSGLLPSPQSLVVRQYSKKTSMHYLIAYSYTGGHAYAKQLLLLSPTV